ncbi:MAG: hypothetical protein K6G69_10835 [Lachnospiraceae bacterium]|nr:hypothetical protein [Lachnospiraceae bacterium]
MQDRHRSIYPIILTTSLDLSVAGDDQLVWDISAFDRYSGTEFYAPTKKSNTFSLTVKNEKGDYDGAVFLINHFYL